MLAEPSPRPTLTVVLWRTVTATPVFLIVKSSCRKFNHSSITEVINCGAKNWIHVIKMLYHTAAVYKHQLYTHIPMQVVNLGMFRQITDLGKRRLSDYRERTDYLLVNPHYFIFSPCSEKSQCARQGQSSCPYLTALPAVVPGMGLQTNTSESKSCMHFRHTQNGKSQWRHTYWGQV